MSNIHWYNETLDRDKLKVLMSGVGMSLTLLEDYVVELSHYINEAENAKLGGHDLCITQDDVNTLNMSYIRAQNLELENARLKIFNRELYNTLSDVICNKVEYPTEYLRTLSERIDYYNNNDNETVVVLDG